MRSRHVLQDFEVQENDLRMKQPITAETIFEDFVEQIETTVDAVATQVPYTKEQIRKYCLHVSGKRWHILQWRQRITP